MPRPLWESRRPPLVVPLICVFVLGAILALGPLIEIWQRTHEPPVCWTSIGAATIASMGRDRRHQAAGDGSRCGAVAYAP